MASARRWLARALLTAWKPMPGTDPVISVCAFAHRQLRVNISLFRVIFGHFLPAGTRERGGTAQKNVQNIAYRPYSGPGGGHSNEPPADQSAGLLSFLASAFQW